MNTWFKSDERPAVALLIAIVVLSGGILHNTAYSFSKANTIAWCACYVIAFTLLLRQYSLKWIPWFTNHGILMALIAGFASLSIFWSTDQFTTIFRTVIFAGGCILATYFSLNLKMDTILKTISIGLLCIMALNVALIFSNPVIGIQDYAGEDLVWRGWFNNKNVLAAPFALAALISIFKIKPVGSSIDWIYAILLAFSLLGLIKADSATCIVAFAVGTTVYATLRILNRNSFSASIVLIIVGIFIACIGLLIAIITGALSDISNVTSVLGRSGDLTGRVDLWINTWAIITEKPILGYGYGAIWAPLNDESVALQLSLLGIHWQEENGVATAHNGLLQLASELGLPLTVFVFLTFFLVMYKKTVGALSRKNDDLYIQVAFFAFLLIHNIAETSLFRGRDIYWILTMLFILQFPSELFRKNFSSIGRKTKKTISRPSSLTSRSLSGAGSTVKSKSSPSTRRRRSKTRRKKVKRSSVETL